MKRCAAKTRAGTPCQRYALKNKKNGRCRLHGGLSTGAKTKEGKERQLAAKLKHGHYTKAYLDRKKQLSSLLKQAKELINS